MCVAGCIATALLTSAQRCMLHNANGGHRPCTRLRQHAVLQQNKNKRSKEKKARNVCQVQGQQLQRRCRVAFDAAVGCTPACNVEALLPLTLSHTHFALSLQLALPLCACVCAFVMRI